LGSQVEALTKEKKEKENVLTNLELMNLKKMLLCLIMKQLEEQQ
jgi:hypothetical protein